MLPHLTTALTGPLLATEARLLGTALPNRFFAYGVLAQLAQFAALLELERTAPKEE